MKIWVTCLLVLFGIGCFGQTKNIKVYFLYGSKPAKGYKGKEKKRFGGINGGHVSIGVDKEIIGFGPKGKFHVFPKEKNRHSYFRTESLASFKKDTVGDKYAVITIPVTNVQYNQIQDIHMAYCNEAPYDYAFTGMRCAAASYDILSQIGIFKPKSKSWMVNRIFYPRRLRKRMFKLAAEKGYKVETQPGRKSRKWEKD
ncbi:MAG: hypothetical protein M0D57_19845 [Sphingobacteriales bacterium JAD_PAG50586_3]|nr:MAG: hypothetical protein M0D57_19845 [Sphingobacteriales bacterium JAD_PAG50586_3]